MREHEVPTHVQAEDRVLLWFTFPQIVALTAVCAVSYGAYSYAPGPSEMRMALAAVIGLAGIAMVVGKIGGRRLPLVAADLLKYRLVARLYAGSPAQLVRSEPPAPVESDPGPLSLMARRAGRGPRRVRVMAKRGLRRMRKSRNRRDGRTPFRPHGWFGKRREPRAKNNNVNGRQAAGRDGKEKRRNGQRRKGGRFLSALLGASALALLLVAVPGTAVADGHEPEGGWTSPEIEFQPPEPVPGRRIFVERLHVSGDSAAVTLRAATGLDLRVRAFGGQTGLALRFWGSARLAEGERIDYSLPLNGPAPSFTFSWEDELGQAGAVTVKEAQLPYPLPAIKGELCDLRITSLGWSPGTIDGTVESECVTAIEELVELPTSAGHHEETVTAVMEAEVTEIAGTITVAGGGSVSSAAFVRDGETFFRLSGRNGRGRPFPDHRREPGSGSQHPPAAADAAHAPPGADGVPHRDGEAGEAWDDQDRQRDGLGDPRRRHDDAARRQRRPVDTERGRPQGRDPHHHAPGARGGRGGRPRAGRPHEGRVFVHGVERGL